MRLAQQLWAANSLRRLRAQRWSWRRGGSIPGYLPRGQDHRKSAQFKRGAWGPCRVPRFEPAASLLEGQGCQLLFEFFEPC